MHKGLGMNDAVNVMNILIVDLNFKTPYTVCGYMSSNMPNDLVQQWGCAHFVNKEQRLASHTYVVNTCLYCKRSICSNRTITVLSPIIVW